MKENTRSPNGNLALKNYVLISYFNSDKSSIFGNPKNGYASGAARILGEYLKDGRTLSEGVMRDNSQALSKKIDGIIIGPFYEDAKMMYQESLQCIGAMMVDGVRLHQTSAVAAPTANGRGIVKIKNQGLDGGKIEFTGSIEANFKYAIRDMVLTHAGMERETYEPNSFEWVLEHRYSDSGLAFSEYDTRIWMGKKPGFTFALFENLQDEKRMKNNIQNMFEEVMSMTIPRAIEGSEKDVERRVTKEILNESSAGFIIQNCTRYYDSLIDDVIGRTTRGVKEAFRAITQDILQLI